MELYPTIAYYANQLPKSKESTIDYTSPWQQSIQYPLRSIAVQPVERIFLPFHKETSVPDIQKRSQNQSLWNLFCERFDVHHSMVSGSYQQQNVSFLIQQLKQFMVEKEIKFLFTSRRMYPILDMLDRPSSEFTKHHRKAIGYLWTFLFQESIYVEEELFASCSKEELFASCSKEELFASCSTEPIKILRNSKGIWYKASDKK